MTSRPASDRRLAPTRHAPPPSGGQRSEALRTLRVPSNRNVPRLPTGKHGRLPKRRGGAIKRRKAADLGTCPAARLCLRVRNRSCSGPLRHLGFDNPRRPPSPRSPRSSDVPGWRARRNPGPTSSVAISSGAMVARQRAYRPRCVGRLSFPACSCIYSGLAALDVEKVFPT